MLVRCEEKLEVIAQTAGMTAEQFSTAWKQKPADALQAFIKGLQRAHDEGKNMDGILDELGMTGIRQGNMLKSLASASDKMGDAVRRSNSAWKENTALTNEAKKRYETTESQLKIFKNQVTDLAIEFGGPLLKAMNSGLQAVKPWISKLADMAKAFSEMSESQQQISLNGDCLQQAQVQPYQSLAKVSELSEESLKVSASSLKVLVKSVVGFLY